MWGLDDDAHDQCQQFRNYNDSSACHDVDEGFCDYQMNKKMSDSDVWYADFVGCSDCDGEWGPCLLGVIVDIQYWCDELTDDTRRARRLARARAPHCLLYTSPSPRDRTRSRMPSSA